MSDIPLVSCIMPTAGRRAFLSRAVDLFLAQDYPRKQLVVVEDGLERNEDLFKGRAAPPDRIDYTHLGPGRRTIGEKRNFACARTRGDLIAHWDDDDWHAPRRLSTQVEALLRLNARLCSLDRLVFYDPEAARAWIYRSVRVPWLAGGSLLYDRSLWREQPFHHVSNGEDTIFVDDAYHRRVPVAVLSDPSIYVATIHPGNTAAHPSRAPKPLPRESTARRIPDTQWGRFDVEEVRRWMAGGRKDRAA